MMLSIVIASFTCLLCLLVFAHPAQSLCENDSNFRYLNRAKVTCKYIRNNEGRRQNLCQNAEVRNACEQACGSCCEDSPTYVLTTDMGTDQNCKWLSKKFSRKERYCERYINHKMVRDACPSACDECKSEVIVDDQKEEPVQEWCMDNQSYKKNNEDKKSCNWVGRSDRRVEKLCPFNIISKNCPQACGLCCGDDSTYKFLSKKGIAKSCSWLNNENRRNRYCDNVISGVLVSRKCPVSCGVCTPPDKTDVPSTSPSVSISPTSWPTNSPTAFPTVSLAPTSLPSSVPTTLPTKYPSTFPTISPTITLSSVPTSHHSSVPTTLPTTSPSTFPTTSPTLQPSSAPSLVCVITANLAFPKIEDGDYGYHNDDLVLTKVGSDQVCGLTEYYNTTDWCTHSGDALFFRDNDISTKDRTTAESAVIHAAEGNTFTITVQHYFNYYEYSYEYYDKDHTIEALLEILVNGEQLATGLHHDAKPEVDTHITNGNFTFVNPEYSGTLSVQVKCDTSCMCEVR